MMYERFDTHKKKCISVLNIYVYSKRQSEFKDLNYIICITFYGWTFYALHWTTLIHCSVAVVKIELMSFCLQPCLHKTGIFHNYITHVIFLMQINLERRKLIFFFLFELGWFELFKKWNFSSGTVLNFIPWGSHRSIVVTMLYSLYTNVLSS